MSGRYLLDTNIIIDIFKNNPDICKSLTDIKEVFVPSIVIGELYFGAYKSTKIQENVKRIDDFVLENKVLSCDVKTALTYGNLKKYLKDKGHPIPENDIWIAAIAQQYGLTLISNDAHFDNIKNLKVIHGDIA
ncbi:MAG: type II toxin-antitoxin system VapC family toxin [Magnetococcales bacterium]|uniref:Ribonuclease VapC n=1 Tax=Candidatus Magnetobacterium casense TaxID=1455061 RepID=A0ABS6RX30_9BACT|nr:type II toxin-antitoxin system VapC family toxin [Candidatus Magnetobacterium casensis]MBF0606074.1 type II toxin-antitoxin system VapC family toxin [Nitrospirota bacterium]MBV6340808.1 type II toxin-antitoxin system VapC family toxin [Candidatus Magnetobacterium casensis]